MAMPDNAGSAPATTPVTLPSGPTEPVSPASTPAATPSTQPETAPSTQPTDVHAGLMDAAKAALAKTAKPGDPSAPATQGQPAPSTNGSVKPPEKAKPGDDDDKLPEIDENTLPHPQREVMRRWKETLDRTREKLKAVEGPAGEYAKIQEYMDAYSLTAEDVAAAYDILAKLRTNPVLAYETLKPIMDALEAQVGVTLPDDIRQRLEQGFVDDATAKELARERAKSAIADNTAKRVGDQATRAANMQLNYAIQNAVAAWDSDRMAKDPDFARKRPLLEDAARAIMAKEGQAQTPDAAL